MNLIKQYDKRLYEPIRTDGCLKRALQSFAEISTRRCLTADEINKAYHYAIPDYMQDYRQPGRNRCYILDHEEIIRIAFLLLGVTGFTVKYAYRKDGDTMIINKAKLKDCNFFSAKLKTDKGFHFVNSDKDGNIMWNPGRSTGEPVSIRGYIIR